MRHSFQPRLINDPFSDPGLFIHFLFDRRALLFDLGDLGNLSARDLLKVSHVFVTHTHIDHFIGFDHLIRVSLGRRKEIHFFGPPGFLRHVEGKLAGYTWNLVGEYRYDLRLRVTEVHPIATLSRTFACKDCFASGEDLEERPFTGTLIEEPSLRVDAVLLDHRTPCLGFALVEPFNVNILKEALSEMDLSVGPWLTRFKKSLHEHQDPQSEFTVTWEEKGGVVKEKRFPLGELAGKIGRISPGQRIVYVTDLIGSQENLGKVVDLASGADHLFIEAAFLDRDREVAMEKYHLTAKEAGEIAKQAGVKEVAVFHFSPRYRGRAEDLRREAMEAWRGGE